MKILYQQEFTNVEGQRIRVSFFKRDARSPREIENNEPERFEHVRKLEIFNEEVWNNVSEEIIEYLVIDINGS